MIEEIINQAIRDAEVKIARILSELEARGYIVEDLAIDSLTASTIGGLDRKTIKTVRIKAQHPMHNSWTGV